MMVVLVGDHDGANDNSSDGGDVITEKMVTSDSDSEGGNVITTHNS
jgi:hypothetical protein